MRILFAVSNENVSDAIVKSYHKNYNDTITFKNVFYFNAIIKEIQRDRSYDRIIISEDLEPFANNNYDAIDKFIYERLEAISEEINDFADTRIPIILICTDRRTKSSGMINKLYNVGIYDALIGSDRRIDNVCKLINTPRTKEEAQQYYKLENIDSKSSLEDVSEEEVQNILSYYKKLGKNEERYTDSFNNIAAQYTDAQLKIIIRYLPINVKAVLEAECPKYQELVTYANNKEQMREEREKERLREQKIREQEEYEEKIKEQYEQKKKEEEKAKLAQKKAGYVPNAEAKNTKQQPVGIDLLDRRINKPGMQGDVLIPNAINTKNAKKVLSDDEMNIESTRTIRPEKINATVNQPVQPVQQVQSQPQVQEQSRPVETTVSQQPKVEQVVSTQTTVQPNTNTSDSVTLPGFDDLDVAIESSMEEKPKTENMQNTVATNNQVTNSSAQPVQQPVPQPVQQVQPQLQVQPMQEEATKAEDTNAEPVKRGRGRPRKYPVDTTPKPKGKRGRPRKNPLPEEVENNENPVQVQLQSSQQVVQEEKNEEIATLPGFEDFDVVVQEETPSDAAVSLPGFEDENLSQDFSSFDTFETPEGKTSQNNNSNNSNNNTATTNNTNSTLPGFEDDEFEDIELPSSTNNQANQNNMMDDDFVNFNTNTSNNNVNSNITSSTTIPEPELEPEVTLPGMEMEQEINEQNVNPVEPIRKEEPTLPGFDEDFEDIENSVPEPIEKKAILPGFEDETPELTTSSVSTATSYRNNDDERRAGIQKLEEKRVYSTGSLESVLTPDKKIVAFIGTSKNGTSFIVNNLASLFSSIGVKTAILDMTKNRNAYYIYTNNDENLRQISYDAIDKLENGVAEGIKVDRNLEVYTAVPSEEKDFSNAEAILTTLAKTQSLVLIDCDFDTPLGYFANAQEIYLVQSMDILTIQPLTAFLRELKTNGILDQEKLRVVVNKEIRVRGLTSKTIIGGMSFYNDPSMSYMTELFNKDKIKACTLPFEDSTYSKYLETLVNCNVSISGYSKSFMNSLKILGNMVYPLLSKQTYIKSGPDYTRSNFSDEMNNTLNQMRNKY